VFASTTLWPQRFATFSIFGPFDRHSKGKNLNAVSTRCFGATILITQGAVTEIVRSISTLMLLFAVLTITGPTRLDGAALVGRF
jgi:hypothetical protein